MAALKTAPATTVSLARFVLETQKKRCDKMIKDGWKAIWGVRRSLEWWSDLKCEKKKAKYGMYLCAMLINQQNGVLMGINGKPIDAEQHLDAVVESTTKLWGLLNMVQDRPPLLLDVKNWAGWLDGVVKQSTSVGYPVLAAGAGISIAAVQSDATPPPAYAPNFCNVATLPCSPIVPAQQILKAPMAPVVSLEGSDPAVRDLTFMNDSTGQSSQAEMITLDASRPSPPTGGRASTPAAVNAPGVRRHHDEGNRIATGHGDLASSSQDVSWEGRGRLDTDNLRNFHETSANGSHGVWQALTPQEKHSILNYIPRLKPNDPNIEAWNRIWSAMRNHELGIKDMVSLVETACPYAYTMDIQSINLSNSYPQSVAEYHRCFKDFKDDVQELLGNGFASFVDLYAVRHAEKEPFFDYVKRFEDRHRHYCEVKGDWTVTLDSDVMIHTAVSGLNSEFKTLYFNTIPPINRWLDFKQWGQRVDISLTEKRDYQKVSARRIAAIEGTTDSAPNPYTNFTCSAAMLTPADNTSHGPPPPGHCYGCKQEGHWADKCPNKQSGDGPKRHTHRRPDFNRGHTNRRPEFNRDAKLMEQMREFFAAMNGKDQSA